MVTVMIMLVIKMMVMTTMMMMMMMCVCVPDLSPELVTQYLQQNGDFLDDYVQHYVNTEQLEGWLAHKTRHSNRLSLRHRHDHHHSVNGQCQLGFSRGWGVGVSPKPGHSTRLCLPPTHDDRQVSATSTFPLRWGGEGALGAGGGG